MNWYGLTPFSAAITGLPDVPLATTKSPVSSSRALDDQGHYLINDQGGYDGMRDVDQRVQLAVSFAAIDTPSIDPVGLETQRSRIATALAPEAKRIDNGIVIDSIDVEHTAVGTVSRKIVFHLSGADTSQTVTP